MTAEDGQEATRLFDAHRDEIAVVVLDLTMPKMDGLQTCDAIRALDGTVPVVLCSGYREPDALTGFEGRRLSGVLHKPYSNAALCTLVDRLVRGAGHD